MADSPTQDGRVGKLATPLGKDKLCLTRFEGSEAIGELFEYRIEAVSTDADLSFNAALGQNCSVHLETTDHVGRDFSGILTEVKWAGMRSNLPLYRLVLRPWPWIMSLRSHCRIFANMNVKDIIKDALGNDIHGPIVDLMIEDYPTLEYTVQYRETSLNFALRMMEKFGIYYYFKFDQGDGDSPSPHYLVLADSTTHEKLPAPKSVLYVPPSAAGPDDTQLFNDWSREQAVIAGIFELNDYDYNKPNANLETHEAHFTPPGESIIHDYPGGYDDKALGDRLTKVRQEAERVFEDRASAAGYAPSLTPGFSMQRTSQNGDSQDDNYLILRCNHWYGDQSYASEGSGQGADGAYSGSYELSRISVPYRMPLRTRRPVIIGSQPAKVISKENQEIDVDKQGRVLVEFYWDDTTGSTPGKKTPSRRVRVGQIWAGLQRGALFIPRVGDEVMVEYEDGDPDRPIIVGSVYNGTTENPGNLVSLTLPDKKTMSGVLGKSSTDGGSTIHNANAWWFDDAKGSEQFLVRARKDLFFRAYNNQNIRVGANVNETVGGDETIDVGPVDVEGAKVGGSNAGGNFTLNAFQSITLNVGPKDAPPLTQIKMDQTSITLSVGPGGLLAQIKMDPTGVTISGTPASQLMVQPAGITTLTPMVTVTYGPVTFVSPSVTIPVANIGVGTVGGILPLI